MNAVAIIAEYNPFHNGHAYLLQEIRKRYGTTTPIVVIMSGSFVQRGEPALFDKWHRAAWALQGGADCVVELPLVYAVSNAEGFAAGAVRLASMLGCDAIACGVESGSATEFTMLAKAALSVKELPVKDHTGLTYGQYMTNFLRSRCPREAGLLDTPNALLALEYTKATCMYAPHMALLPIRRLGTTHDGSIAHQTFASASALRRFITADQPETIAPYVPHYVYADIQELYQKGHYTDYERYHDMVLYTNRFTSPDILRSYPAFAEGLEHRWHRIFSTAPTWDQAMAALKTRRYSYSRLCRMGVYTTLRLSQHDLSQSNTAGPVYARILGLRPLGRALIKSRKNTVPFLTKLSIHQGNLPPAGQQQLYCDLAATDLQSLSMKNAAFRTGQQDYTTSPCMFL